VNFIRNPEQRKLLENKNVLLVGCGSMGSALSEMLVRAGVGNLTLIDPENLAPENLVRHMLTQKDLGRPKVEAMKERLLEINPECAVTARQEDFRTVTTLDTFDLVLSAADSYQCESHLNYLSWQRKIPAVYTGCWAEARAGEILYVVPDQTPCYECFASFRQHQEISQDVEKYSDPEHDKTRVPGQAGLWPRILIVCGFTFEVILGIFTRSLDDPTLWLVGITDPDLCVGITKARVKMGCAICDESKIEELTA
jgi:molybdopterin/thiamine biosynthesis adenylyltransferase